MLTKRWLAHAFAWFGLTLGAFGFFAGAFETKVFVDYTLYLQLSMVSLLAAVFYSHER
ncbi:MAG: hypothetical protein HY341_00760 [Candidatus Kerfeldbacteria bacterium]|nr:hypothetical protein [Candidatus Kerfeldbacteria bacterium]